MTADRFTTQPGDLVWEDGEDGQPGPGAAPDSSTISAQLNAQGDR